MCFEEIRHFSMCFLILSFFIFSTCLEVAAGARGVEMVSERLRLDARRQACEVDCVFHP